MGTLRRGHSSVTSVKVRTCRLIPEAVASQECDRGGDDGCSRAFRATGRRLSRLASLTWYGSSRLRISVFSCVGGPPSEGADQLKTHCRGVEHWSWELDVPSLDIVRAITTRSDRSLRVRQPKSTKSARSALLFMKSPGFFGSLHSTPSQRERVAWSISLSSATIAARDFAPGWHTLWDSLSGAEDLLAADKSSRQEMLAQ